MLPRLLGYGSLFSILCISSLAAADMNSDGAAPIVEINGTKITLSEFEQKQPTALLKARNTYFEAEKKAVNAFIDQYLLEQQAKKENLTVDQLLDKHVKDALPPDPSDDALHVYFEGVDTKDSFEKLKPQIIDHIRQLRMDKAKAAYIQSLHDDAKIAMLLTPPHATVPVKDTWARGVADAPVTIIEYADYECPYCQRQQPVLDKIEADFNGKINFVYKDTPLPGHPHAEKAAEAARCAGAQGKFWEYHDQLFATKQLEIPQLKKLAGALKLDQEAFDKCLDSGEVAAKVKENINEALSLQIEGTPTFLVNGRYINGSMSYDELKKLIEEESKSPAHTTDTATR